MSLKTPNGKMKMVVPMTQCAHLNYNMYCNHQQQSWKRQAATARTHRTAIIYHLKVQTNVKKAISREKNSLKVSLEIDDADDVFCCLDVPKEKVMVRFLSTKRGKERMS